MSPVINLLNAISNGFLQSVSTEAPNDHITAKIKMPLVRVTLNFYSIAANSSGLFSIYFLIFYRSMSRSLSRVWIKLKDEVKQMVLSFLTMS